MKTKAIAKKEFDAVKFMRETRDKISLEIQNMNFEELKKYYEQRRLKLAKLKAQPPIE
jgi:predicted nucleotide-binding protein (sugar kinase/HSP70/actin superfamily)